MANSGLQRMMTLGFPKQKLNLNESENPLDFGFAKFVGIRQHSDLDSNSVTSLTGTGIFTGQMLPNHRHQSIEEKTLNPNQQPGIILPSPQPDL